VAYLCVLPSAAEVEEKRVVVMGLVVHAAHPPHCWSQKETLTLEELRAARHSISRLQSDEHLGNAGAVSHDEVVE
jgi:hypothetical protein